MSDIVKSILGCLVCAFVAILVVGLTATVTLSRADASFEDSCEKTMRSLFSPSTIISPVINSGYPGLMWRCRTDAGGAVEGYAFLVHCAGMAGDFEVIIAVTPVGIIKRVGLVTSSEGLVFDRVFLAVPGIGKKAGAGVSGWFSRQFEGVSIIDPLRIDHSIVFSGLSSVQSRYHRSRGVIGGIPNAAYSAEAFVKACTDNSGHFQKALIFSRGGASQ